MISKLLFLLSVIIPLIAGEIDPFLTAKGNQCKTQAQEAFSNRDYPLAIAKYKYLLDTLHINDEKAELNLAHAYMKKADYSNASLQYTKSTTASDPKIRSIAYQQLGILKSEKGDKEEAINFFKSALRQNPLNKEARHNYELLVRSKEQEMPKPQDQKERKEQEQKNKEDQQKKEQKSDSQKGQEEKNKDGKGDPNNKDKSQGGKEQEKKEEKKGKEDNKSNQGEQEKGNKEESQKPEDDKDKKGAPKDDKKDNPDKPGEKKQDIAKEDLEGDKKGEVKDAAAKEGNKKDKKDTKTTIVNKEQLQKMNMTEQQAKALLNAMRQQEVQYIQQQKKQSTKRSDQKNYKDW